MMGIQKMRYYMALLIFMNKFPSRDKNGGPKMHLWSIRDNFNKSSIY